MRLLLDTHVVLWWLMDSPELSVETKDLLDHESDVYLSAASVWEVGLVHQDPFDRTLIAQAKCEDLVVVTRDRFIPRYEVATLPA